MPRLGDPFESFLKLADVAEIKLTDRLIQSHLASLREGSSNAQLKAQEMLTALGSGRTGGGDAAKRVQDVLAAQARTYGFQSLEESVAVSQTLEALEQWVDPLTGRVSRRLILRWRKEQRDARRVAQKFAALSAELRQYMERIHRATAEIKAPPTLPENVGLFMKYRLQIALETERAASEAQKAIPDIEEFFKSLASPAHPK